MTLIVQKFGGTSVADLDRIAAAAAKAKAEVDRGNRVVVVVSAMAGVTDQLVGYARDIAPVHDAREFDVVVSAGEQITSGLMAMALQGHGLTARSWLGWQMPLRTSDAHGRARILGVATGELHARLDRGEVPVVAGFQGISDDGRVTTLGRGGTDTTAVAVAAALKAARCDIYTDVDGVYTADPRIVTRARRLQRITFEEMLELASLGAKVLQGRSVELAMKEAVPVQVLSSFDDAIGSDYPGTMVVGEEEIMEQEMVSGVTYSRNDAKVTLVGVDDRPGVAATIFGRLADANVVVDMIVQNVSEDGTSTDITFTVGRDDLDSTVAHLNALQENLHIKRILPDPNVAKVSVIGVGMRSHTGVAQRMFQTLAEKGINIQVISTSEIKISVLIAEEFTELALRALHTAYHLDA